MKTRTCTKVRSQWINADFRLFSWSFRIEIQNRRVVDDGGGEVDRSRAGAGTVQGKRHEKSEETLQACISFGGKESKHRQNIFHE
jgi:hypothetical protein